MKHQPTINIHNQDCMEAMAKMEDNAFELSIIDPPYGINRSKNFGKREFGWKQYKRTDWDNSIPTGEFWSELFRVSKNQIIWGANYMVEYLPPSMGWILWNKKQRNFSTSDGELAFTSFQKKLKIFDYSRAEAVNNNKNNLIHPTQKPVALYKWLLKNYATEGDKILDTHLGSGSIAIACHDMGFDLEAYEIDQEYHQAALQRLNTHRSQLQMF